MTNNDLIRRSDALECFHDWIDKHGDVHTPDEMPEYRAIEELPSVEPKRTENTRKTHACDLIDRRALMKEFSEFVKASNNSDFARTPTWNDAVSLVGSMPSAQPERTCVNCGRTANNGGWYADGRTRCPIEEHYALPKDGYCHLWEKRNVTDDDYPERRTDDCKDNV